MPLFATIKQGSINTLFVTTSYGSGSIKIGSGATCTLYDANKVIIFSNTAVTGRDTGYNDKSSAWLLLNTASLTPAQLYTLSFTLPVVDSRGTSRVEIHDIEINLRFPWEDVDETVTTHPSYTNISPESYWSGYNLLTNKGNCNAPVASGPGGLFFTTSSDLFATYVTRRQMLASAVNNLIGMGFVNQSGETPTANNVTIKAAFRFGGTNYPLTFGGNSSVTLAPAQSITSDLTAVPTSIGSIINCAVSPSVGTIGQKWPIGISTFTGNGLGEGFTSGADLTTGLTAPGAFTGFTFGPNQILGTSTTPFAPSVAGYGDSILQGVGNTQNTANADESYLTYALNKLYGYQLIAASGESLATFLPTGGHVYRMPLTQGCTTAFVEYGTNDCYNSPFYTDTVIITNLMNLAILLRSMGFTRVIGQTITPRTTSTDSWATVGNQTVLNTHSENDHRVTVNTAWRANQISGYDAYSECATAVESSLNSGKWRVDLGTPSVDGIHPSNVLHLAMAATVNTALII